MFFCQKKKRFNLLKFCSNGAVWAEPFAFWYLLNANTLQMEPFVAISTVTGNHCAVFTLTTNAPDLHGRISGLASIL